MLSFAKVIGVWRQQMPQPEAVTRRPVGCAQSERAFTERPCLSGFGLSLLILGFGRSERPVRWLILAIMAHLSGTW